MLFIYTIDIHANQFAVCVARIHSAINSELTIASFEDFLY
jgi:hypothetical protein